MAATFSWIYLGTSTSVLDRPRNTVAEGAEPLSRSDIRFDLDPLYNHITSVTMINNGGNATARSGQQRPNDQFSTNIGAGTQTFTFDATIVYNTTITYADGTTGTVSMVMAQDTAGACSWHPSPQPPRHRYGGLRPSRSSRSPSTVSQAERRPTPASGSTGPYRVR
ncbi:MAG: hypothetical protein R3D46_14805 [Defluviimonas denitrificans]